MEDTDVTHPHMAGSDPGMPAAGVAVSDVGVRSLPASGLPPSSTPDTTGSDPGTARGAMT